MKLKVFAYAALFGFAPLMSFLVGAVYSGIVERALSVSCFSGGATSAACLPGQVLTLGGFMPAVLIFTIPAAALFLIGYVVVSLRRRAAPPPST